MKIKTLLSFLLAALFANMAYGQMSTIDKQKVLYPYLSYTPKNYYADSSNFPLLIYLHGHSHGGSDLNKLKIWGPPEMISKGMDFPFIVVSPQCPSGKYWSSDNWFEPLLKDLNAKYRIDKKRIYLTGISMGGYGTWQTAMEYPYIIAAIVPICGGGDTNYVCNLKNIPVWTFHGTADQMVPIRGTQDLVDALTRCGGKAIFTKIENAGHEIAGVYREYPAIYDWLAKQHKK
jgi:predicted peptidase